MKRLLVFPTVAAVALALSAFALANNGHGHKNKQPHPNKATVLVHTTDGSCSGGTWADDTIMRTIKVHQNKDGSYRIREQDKGFFSTNAGGAVASPGNCPQNTSKHGHTVRTGVVGTLKGYITGTVTGGTFNPNATCTPAACTQSVFIASFFGPTAQFSCLTNSQNCKFNYDYHAKKDQNLLFRHWRDKGHGAGTFLKEVFRGDIADA
jgi:hypothetical protein